MPKLPSYLELIDRLKSNYDFCEFHRPTDELLIDQENKEFFSKTYSITDIHPLLVDYSRTVLLFLNDHDISFCEVNQNVTCKSWKSINCEYLIK